MMKFSIFYRFLLITVIGSGLMACGQSMPNDADNTLARVGSEYLTIDKAKSEIPDFVFNQDSIGALKKYREDWVRKQVILQEANRLGISQNEEVQKKLRKAREEVLRNALRDYIIASKQEDITVTDEEARNYFQENKNQFVLDEEFVQYRHLRARTVRDARAAKQDLLNGVSWPEVAREYGIDGELAIEKSDQFQPISMALSNISIMNRYLNIIGQNEISPIQRVNGVYHFVQLTESRAKGQMPELDWLIPKVKDWMVIKKKRQNFSSFVKNLYLKAKSNNEVESFNVLPTQTNPNTTIEDTLESNLSNE